jgi:BTB/POZ domain
MFIASTPDMSTSSNTPIVSSIFDETTGDFALISSDETIFHVPRAVLQLSSKVFEAMFEAGTPSTEDVAPIRMQADAQHLEMILKLTHPGHISPIISDITTLAELLRIAKQYEMESVKDQLRVWFMKERIEDGMVLQSIIAASPLAAFVVATSFECVDEARYALKEVIKCDLCQDLGACKNYEIPLYLMQYILKLRAGRATWLKTRLKQFSKLARNHCMFAANHGHSSATKEEAVDLCLTWEQNASEALEAVPSFTTLKIILCDASFGSIPDNLFRTSDLKVVWKMMTELEERAKELEFAPLPELDKTLGL